MNRHLLKFNFVLLNVLLLAACSPSPSPQVLLIQPSATPQPPTPTQTNTPLATSTITPTPTMTVNIPTETAIRPTHTMTPKPTLPLEITQTPGIIVTATALAATTTADYLNNLTLLGPLADMMGIMQYFNPVGTPAHSWHDIPIMPQASTGQEFKSDIYSFKAKATLSTAAKFYNDQADSLKWSCNPTGTGTSGTGSIAQHSVTMMCQGFVISMTSFDNDTSQVIVVLNKAP